MSEPQVYLHPEWKRLYDALQGAVSAGQLWEYSKLTELAGIDVTGNRGRHQALKCFRDILRRKQLKMENVKNVGYRVIDPKEQNDAALKRVKHARSRMKAAQEIAGNTRIDQLSAEQARINADLLVRISRNIEGLRGDVKEIRKQIGASEPKRLPSPMLDSKPAVQ